MNDEARTILVVDDEPGHRLMVRAVLSDAGWSVEEAPDGKTGLRQLDATGPDAVLLDMRMPGMDGLAVLRAIRAREADIPVVMLTAFGDVGTAVEAMKQGAFDFLTKPVDNDELEAVLDKAWRYRRLTLEKRGPQERGGDGPRLIGTSPTMIRLRELIEQVGPSEATVLVTGESGVGKELVAESLHLASPRAGWPLVKVNCAALPHELLESELFGYAKGAFTGANTDKPGRFQLADGGTLFLDEIGEMDMAVQAKLLRALQERVVEPLGSTKPTPTDVRVVAATNKDLAARVAEGEFREDLYYRLNVIELHIPPLRERKEDIPELAGFLLGKIGEKNASRVRSVHPEFLEALRRYDWPGNVRELENVLERAVILARSDTLTPDLLPPRLAGEAEQPAQAPAETPLDEAEKEAIARALAEHDGHRQQTADALGISRRTLQYKLKKYGLSRRRG